MAETIWRICKRSGRQVGAVGLPPGKPFKAISSIVREVPVQYRMKVHPFIILCSEKK